MGALWGLCGGFVGSVPPPGVPAGCAPQVPVGCRLLEGGPQEVLGTAGGLSGCAGGLSHCPGCPPPCPRGSRTPAPPGDAAATHLQLAEKEQALLLAQETVQVSGTGTVVPPPPPSRCAPPPPPGTDRARFVGGGHTELRAGPAQLLQLKVRRLEQLLRLKDTRIDDLSRRLQREQR